MLENKRRSDILSFKDGESFNNYKILTKPGTVADNKAVPLGEGGSSEVYLAEQLLGDEGNVAVKRAIKFFVFRDDIEQEDGISGRISEENFKDEIVSISKFNHENIIKVIDGGVRVIQDENVPFIVTDYIEGHTLKDLLSSSEIFKTYVKKEDDIFNVLSQIFEGLIYLHKQNFYHCDIAPKNIFIRRSDRQVIIGDLGVGKTLKQGKDTSHKLKVIGTKSFMPEEALKVVNQEISYAEFEKLQPQWDLYSLKKTIAQFVEAYDENFRNEKSWYRSLNSLLQEEFEDLEEIGEKIMWTNPHNRQFHNVSELSEADSSEGGSKELQPIRSVWITDRIKAIIRHPSYSRLKKTPQLLSGNTFNPGSNHSRYEHSLGTYEHMRLTLVSMLRSENFLGLLNKSNIELALTAALLSNLSKYPFSFVIDEIQARNQNYFALLRPKQFLRELLELKPSEAPDQSIADILKERFPGVDYEMLCNIISGEPVEGRTKAIKIINKLLHCTIDVRVIDFLQRDSYHVGISHGAHIDFDGLVSNLRLHNDTIAIDSKGVTNVEQVVTLRYWLYKRIYWNTLNRAYTAVLTHLYVVLKQEKTDFESCLHSYVKFHHPVEVLHFIKSQIDALKETNETLSLKLKNLLITVTSQTPKVFKELFLINQSESSSAEFKLICSKLGRFSCEEIENLRHGLEEKLSNLFPFQNDQVNILIDIPPDEPNKKLGEDITVLKTVGDDIQIEKMSGIVAGISSSFDESLRFLRVYINPIYEMQLPLKKEKATEEIKQFLLDNIAN